MAEDHSVTFLRNIHEYLVKKTANTYNADLIIHLELLLRDKIKTTKMTSSHS
jgi:hypothetical protein